MSSATLCNWKFIFYYYHLLQLLLALHVYRLHTNSWVLCSFCTLTLTSFIHIVQNLSATVHRKLFSIGSLPLMICCLYHATSLDMCSFPMIPI